MFTDVGEDRVIEIDAATHRGKASGVSVTATNKPRSDAGLSETFAEARTGLFRATLLFGSIAVALALIVVPAVDHPAKVAVADTADGIDPIITGSTTIPDIRRYTLRRSVLDGPRSGPCLLFPDGTQRGKC